MPRNKDWNQILREGHDNYSQKIVTDGSIMYIATAPLGTPEDSPHWQCMKIDKSISGTIRITWANGDDSFDNAADDLPSLTYV